MKGFLTIAASTVMLAGAPVESQETVFIVRHAEKELSGEDPGLTADGRARSAAWAAMLAQAEIAHVITTDAKRTRETGGIIAETLGVAQTQIAMTDVAGLLDALSFDHADDRILVVGHTETIPSILSGLGYLDLIEIDQSDYANLFVFNTGAGESSDLIHMRMP